MELTYDPNVDAFHFELERGTPVARTIEWGPGVYVDVDARSRVLCIEVVGASRHFDPAILAALQAPETMLTLSEAASESGLSAGTLRVLLHNGRLPGEKRGRDWQVSLSDLYSYLESRAPAGRPAKSRKARRAKRTILREQPADAVRAERDGR